MNLDDVEACSECAAGCGSERGLHLSDARGVELMRLSVALGEGDGAGCGDVAPSTFRRWEQGFAFPGTALAGLASRMGELDRRVCALSVEEVDDARKHGDVPVFPDAEVIGRNSALGQNCGGLGEDQARASDGSAAEMHQVPVIGEAVDARILAHGRDGDAIGQSDTAECNRREEMIHSHQIRIYGLRMS